MLKQIYVILFATRAIDGFFALTQIANLPISIRWKKCPTAILITQDGIIWFSFNGGIVRGSDLDNAVRHTQASK